MNTHSEKFNTLYRPIIVLTVICFVVSALLGVTNHFTAPIIAANTAKAAEEARTALLPEADSFTKLEYSDSVISEVYKANNGAGFVMSGSAKGYGGKVPVMVGIKSDGTISSIKVMDNDESPGIGKKTMLSSFTDRFVGKTSADGVDAVAGASYSSKAVFTVVNAAAAAFQTVKGA